LSVVKHEIQPYDNLVSFSVSIFAGISNKFTFCFTETIFVRVCESRMDFLRAVIIGPQGTPYHDGLFFFDCFFPPNYPAVPPVCIINVRRVLRCALCCV
jgi:hypothetical protein